MIGGASLVPPLGTRVGGAGDFELIGMLCAAIPPTTSVSKYKSFKKAKLFF
jgi:hypothetical protein